MSRPRDPSHPSASDPAEHPEELLAAYTDGSATASEVAAAEAHLAGCDRCRSEVRIARGALVALRGLPELVTPWADTGSIGGSIGKSIAGAGTPVPRETPAPVRSLAHRRARSRRTAAALVGLAAAASVAAVVVFAVHPGRPVTPAAGSARLSARGGPPTVTEGQLGILTAHLAGGTKSAGTAPAQFGSASTAPEPEGALPVQATIDPNAAVGVPCARRVSGESASAVAVYAQLAMFDGKRVWVVGFITTPANGGSPRVEVVAATTSDCTLVYTARQALSG